MNDESSLRDLFRQVREADAVRVPSLGSILERRQRPKARFWIPAGALVLVGLIFLLWRPTTPQPPVSISRWRSPTAFLLETPERPFLRELPQIGQIHEEVFSCESCF
jgi:hypothetical protein